MIDPTAALAKMAETALAASPELNTPAKLGAALLAIWHIDRTQAAGYFTDQASTVLDALIDGIRACTGVTVQHPRNYVWYLASCYGKMAAESSTPSKMEIIYAAFFSEFNEKFNDDANVAMFRTLVEKLDYNEALFLAGAWSLVRDRPGTQRSPRGELRRTRDDVDYHIARSLLSRGELFVVIVEKSGAGHRDISTFITPALGRFVEFIGTHEFLD